MFLGRHVKTEVISVAGNHSSRMWQTVSIRFCSPKLFQCHEPDLCSCTLDDRPYQVPVVNMTSETRPLNALLRTATIDDHEEVLRACDASLKQSKQDIRSLHAKVVALLKLDRYEDALNVLEDGGGALKDEAQLERCYALYKTGQLDEARRIATDVDDDRGARHVEAQAVCVHQSSSRLILMD